MLWAFVVCLSDPLWLLSRSPFEFGDVEALDDDDDDDDELGETATGGLDDDDAQLVPLSS